MRDLASFVLGPPVRVRDARGRLVTLLDPSPIVARNATPEGRAAATARRLSWAECQACGAGTMVIGSLIAVAAVGWAALAGRMMWWEVGFALLMAVSAGIISWRDGRRLRAGAIAEGIVASGYCASCGYSLANLGPEGGCVTCPECGAGWSR